MGNRREFTPEQKAKAKENSAAALKEYYENLNEFDKRVLKLKVDFPSISKAQIASNLDCHHERVVRSMRKAMWQKAYAEYTDPDQRGRMQRLAPQLVSRWIALAMSQDPTDKKMAANMLTRYMYGMGIFKGNDSQDSNMEAPVVKISFERSDGQKEVLEIDSAPSVSPPKENL